MSYISEVLVHGETKWCQNSMVYATEDEAVRAGKELASRWMLVTDSRAVPTDNPVNAEFPPNFMRPRLIETTPAT